MSSHSQAWNFWLGQDFANYNANAIEKNRWEYSPKGLSQGAVPVNATGWSHPAGAMLALAKRPRGWPSNSMPVHMISLFPRFLLAAP